MKIAFAHWNNRIAPVFDTAQQICVVDAESGKIVSEAQEALLEDLPVRKTLQLVELGINALVCGAISRPMYGLIVAYGIQVVPFVAGELDDVIQAWLSGELESDTFAMPGCCGRRGRHFGGMDGDAINRRGRGMRTEGAFPHCLDRRLLASSTGCCVCPQCGHKEHHQPGNPCVERTCPQCGAVLTRR